MDLKRLFSAPFWKSLPGRLGAGRSPRDTPVADREGLAYFLRTRSSHVAQTALYGYLRTRAGTRFPELFSDDSFVASINIAKWHVWLASVSDLAVYAGGLVRRRTHAPAVEVGALMQGVVQSLLEETGVPAEAGNEYEAHARRVRARIALCEWGALQEGEGPFSESPEALVHWAPIVDELKSLDAEIVRNSVRFRWLEVRQNLQRVLNAESLVGRGGQAVEAANAAARHDDRGA